MNKPTKFLAFFPLFLSIALALGFLLGINTGGTTSLDSNDKESIIVYNSILNYVEDNYVDEVNRDRLMEQSISSMLEKLDPHSAYIPASQTEEYGEQLRGNFGGVGVSFRIFRDTLMVINTVEGGPSEREGIRAGDRIIEVDGENIAGTGLQTEGVFEKLKGAPGSMVTLTVNREGDIKKFYITRGLIPLKSINSYYMINGSVGYIYLNKFSTTTETEFLRAMAVLKSGGMESLILDLRGNHGGYLDQAIEIADEFLGNSDLIVYTQGRKRDRKDYRARRPGSAEDVRLAVLIDEESASASEIVAGAIQDNDRGFIIGRRSFGKGLVQERRKLSDNSEIRLTIARYYTPSGRSIQRPYGNGINYREDHFERYENGEYYAIDSSVFVDSLKYHTIYEKRAVYGGGGIMPDYFVPLDTTDFTNTFRNLTVIADEFVFFYLDNHRDALLERYPTFTDFGGKFKVDDALLKEFVRSAENDFGLQTSPEEVKQSMWRIKLNLKQNLAWHLYGEVGASYVRAEEDPTILKAMEVLKPSQNVSFLR